MLHLLVFPIVVSFFMWFGTCLCEFILNRMGFHSLQSDFSFASISISVIPRVQGKKVMFIFGAGFPEPYQQDIFESHIKSDTGLPSELLPGSFLPPRTSPELKFLTTSLPLQAEFSCLCFPISQFKWGRTLEEPSLQQGLNSLLHARQGHFSCPWTGRWDSSPQHRGLQPGQASQRTISAANCAARSSS